MLDLFKTVGKKTVEQNDTNIQVSQLSKKEKLEILLDIHTPEGKSWTFEEDGDEYKTRCVGITPDLAKVLLQEFNNTNRPITEVNVLDLYKEMINGKWRFNGETITFNEFGDITNGQHRCEALVKSNKTFNFLVVTGLDKDSFGTIDNGRKRATSDVMAHNGVLSAKNTAALCKFIFGFYNGTYCAHRNASRRTLVNTSIMDFYNTLDKDRLHNCLNFAQTYSKKSNKIIAPTVLAGMFYFFEEVNDSKAFEFLSKLCTGDNLDANSPILALRNKLTKAKIEKNYHITQDMLIKTIVYCWEKFLNDEKVKNIKLPEDYKINIQFNLPL